MGQAFGLPCILQRQAGRLPHTMSSRREKIEAMLKEEPEDQFLRYSLACEFDNEERSDESLALLRNLMSDRPPHVHSFLRGAQLLVKLDRIEDARAALREGIEVARQQGELHAAGEMGELLASLGERANKAN